MAIDAKRIINGTYGEAWCNGVQYNETKALQAKISKNKETISQAGVLMNATKVVSTDGKGSVTFYKVDSSILSMELDALEKGIDLKHTLITKLNDPDSWGCERLALEGVSFDDITLADWELAKLGEVEFPFTFEKVRRLDVINKR